MTPHGTEPARTVSSPVLPVAELVARCVAGDDAARAIFVGEYGPIVRQAVLRKLRSLTNAAPVRADADDLCHEVFERILENGCRRLGELRQPESIVYWLTAIAQRQVMSSVRQWASRSKLYEAAELEKGPDPVPRPDDAAMTHEDAVRIRVALATLPAFDRLVLELYYLQGLQYHEIAQMTGRKIGVISSQLFRAKRKLRDAFLASTESANVDTGDRENRWSR